LLSALAHIGHKEIQDAEHAFHSGAVLLSRKPGEMALLPRGQCNWNVLDDALARLAVAAPQIKKRVLSAALGCIAADGHVTVAEGELLRAIADALDCPMPPLMAGSVSRE
jgi:hypothetical protein